MHRYSYGNSLHKEYPELIKSKTPKKCWKIKFDSLEERRYTLYLNMFWSWRTDLIVLYSEYFNITLTSNIFLWYFHLLPCCFKLSFYRETLTEEKHISYDVYIHTFYTSRQMNKAIKRRLQTTWQIIQNSKCFVFFKRKKSPPHRLIPWTYIVSSFHQRLSQCPQFPSLYWQQNDFIYPTK